MPTPKSSTSIATADAKFGINIDDAAISSTTDSYAVSMAVNIG